MIGGLRDAVGDRVLRRLGRTSARLQEEQPLAADLLESEDQYLAVFDAPGADPEDVQVRYADGRILVRVERFRSFHEGFEMRFPGRGLSMDGEIELPEDAVVNAGQAEATLTDAGTLEVRLPRLQESSSTSDVEITTSDEGVGSNDGAIGSNDGAVDSNDGAVDSNDGTLDPADDEFGN